MTLIVIRFVIKLREYFFKVVLKITALYRTIKYNYNIIKYNLVFTSLSPENEKNCIKTN